MFFYELPCGYLLIIVLHLSPAQILSFLLTNLQKNQRHQIGNSEFMEILLKSKDSQNGIIAN